MREYNLYPIRECHYYFESNFPGKLSSVVAAPFPCVINLSIDQFSLRQTVTRGDILKIISVKARMTHITTWCFFKKGKLLWLLAWKHWVHEILRLTNRQRVACQWAIIRIANQPTVHSFPKEARPQNFLTFRIQLKS